MNEIEYEKMYEVENTHWWYASLHRLILSVITAERVKQTPLEILDAGCGTGRLGQLMAGFGNVSCFDISEKAVNFCGARNMSSVFQADINTVDLGESRYDVITSIDVLCHETIPDERLIFRKFFNSLIPGGILILNLPAYDFLKSRHDLAVHTRKRYLESELLDLLSNTGFIIRKSSYRVFFLFPLIAVHRLVQKLITNLRSGGKISSDVGRPAPAINKMLLWLNLAENAIIKKFHLPFGTSVFVVAAKPDGGKK